jgi:predicted acetyltransferase
MMMSPEVYREEIKKYTKEELLNEKNKLESFINNYNNDTLTEEEKNYKPSPEAMVNVYKEYLKEIEKINK